MSELGLEQLLEKVAASLEEGVLPHVGDHYAQMQIRATRDLLRLLATRVEWRHDQREASLTETRHALGAVARLAPEIVPVSDATSLASARAALGGAIEKTYQIADAEARDRIIDAVWTVVRADYDRERGTK